MEEITLLLIADNLFINASCPEPSLFSLFVPWIVKGQILLKAIQERGRKLTLRDGYSPGKIDVNRFQALLPLSIMHFHFLLWIFIFHAWNLKLKYTHTGIGNTESCPTQTHWTTFLWAGEALIMDTCP